MQPFKTYLKEASADKAKKGGDEAYEAFFNKALKKFGIKKDELDDLSDEKTKEFFDYVEKNWKADDENKENFDKT